MRRFLPIVAVSLLYSAGVNSEPSRCGVCFVAGPREFVPNAFDELAGLGVNWISATPFGWMGDGSPTVHTRTTDVWWGESDDGLRATFAGARRRGIRILLNPHIWLRRRGSDEWRGSISLETEDEWVEWETTYRAFMMHYARLAEEEGADALCIGTELRTTVNARPAFWRALVDSVRNVYGGELTYAANWYREYEEVSFWDTLDFVGIQGYFPLVVANGAVTVEQLTKAWGTHLEALEPFQKKVGKPLVFTEVGYRSAADGAAEPWIWGSAAPVDARLQAACYEAMFRVFWDRPWFDGVFFWKWYPYPERRTGRRDRDFTPQGKPAETVMAGWFADGRGPAEGEWIEYPGRGPAGD